MCSIENYTINYRTVKFVWKLIVLLKRSIFEGINFFSNHYSLVQIYFYKVFTINYIILILMLMVVIWPQLNTCEILEEEFNGLLILINILLFIKKDKIVHLLIT